MRKVLALVWGAIVALFGLFGVQLNLVSEIDWSKIVAALLIIAVWVVTEAVKDWKAFTEEISQENRWGDPGFWMTAITSVILPFLQFSKLELSDSTIGLIATGLALLIPVIVNKSRVEVEEEEEEEIILEEDDEEEVIEEEEPE